MSDRATTLMLMFVIVPILMMCLAALTGLLWSHLAQRRRERRGWEAGSWPQQAVVPVIPGPQQVVHADPVDPRVPPPQARATVRFLPPECPRCHLPMETLVDPATGQPTMLACSQGCGREAPVGPWVGFPS